MLPAQTAVMLPLVVGIISVVVGLVAAEYDRPELLSIGCGGRLERALDALRRENIKRVRHDEQKEEEEEEEDAGLAYQQELRSAPLEMVVSRINVKLPRETSGVGEGGSGPWARVERCVFEPGNDSLQTRVTFKEMSVSGIVSLHPRDRGYRDLAESCRMILRLRRAGMDFLTIPISRGRGQMRIRTESSFMEPRFASIYAYGCHPTRVDKQIKRQDKWWPSRYASTTDELQGMPTTATNPVEGYEAAEPRSLSYGDRVVSNQQHLPTAVARANESARQSRGLSAEPTRLNASLWRKNVWITRSSERKRRWTNMDAREPSHRGSRLIASSPGAVVRGGDGDTSGKDLAKIGFHPNPRVRRTVGAITPEDFAKVPMAERPSNHVTLSKKNVTTNGEPPSVRADDREPKFNSKRENHQEIPRENGELFFNDKFEDATISQISRDDGTNKSWWESKEHVAREMEDVFLRGASQALTRYIERQLHPAIKETLMLSMGYTISYG